MKTLIAELEGISPLGFTNFVAAEKLQGENSKDYESRTWRDRLHVDDKDNVIIPPMMFKNCLSGIAKFLGLQIPGKGKSTYTKHIEAGVMVTEPLVLPIKKQDVKGLWLLVPSDGVRGGGKRVEKCFPVIQEWSGEVPFIILDDTVLSEYSKVKGRVVTVFEYHLVEAGKFQGIGFFRPRNNGYFGRFKVNKIREAD